MSRTLFEAKKQGGLHLYSWCLSFLPERKVMMLPQLALYSDSVSCTYELNPRFIEKIFALKNAGVNINLEVCGVTVHGMGFTNADLYSSANGMIHVNQGAIGRIIDLEQHKFALIKE